MIRGNFRLREKCLSGKVDGAMHDFLGAIGRALAKRFANRKTATLAALFLFSLIFLLGSSPALHFNASLAGGASLRGGLLSKGGGSPPIPSAGGMPALGSGNDASESSSDSSATADRGLYFTAYRVALGDTLSDIAEAFNVTLDTVVSFNGIRNARSLQPGSLLKIPSMSGIVYTAKAGDSVSSVAAANGVSADRVIETNGLLSPSLEAGRSIFLPDAKLASFTLREISGDLFNWPARGWISSWYGWRSDPFTGTRTFHNGIDIGVDPGTPVRAAMEGTVSETGYNSGYGNYIILYHHAGWMTLYGHLQTISVQEGQRVAAGQRIAYSGNTGYSTGPHLHFSVFKNGRTMNPYNVLH